MEAFHTRKGDISGTLTKSFSVEPHDNIAKSLTLGFANGDCITWYERISCSYVAFLHIVILGFGYPDRYRMDSNHFAIGQSNKDRTVAHHHDDTRLTIDNSILLVSVLSENDAHAFVNFCGRLFIVHFERTNVEISRKEIGQYHGVYAQRSISSNDEKRA